MDDMIGDDKENQYAHNFNNVNVSQIIDLDPDPNPKGILVLQDKDKDKDKKSKSTSKKSMVKSSSSSSSSLSSSATKAMIHSHTYPTSILSNKDLYPVPILKKIRSRRDSMLSDKRVTFHESVLENSGKRITRTKTISFKLDYPNSIDDSPDYDKGLKKRDFRDQMTTGLSSRRPLVDFHQARRPMVLSSVQEPARSKIVEVFGLNHRQESSIHLLASPLIKTESPYRGENLLKRFDGDFVTKQRHVWIDLQKKILCWSKTSNINTTNPRTKYKYLTLKMKPFTTPVELLSTLSSSSSDPSSYPSADGIDLTDKENIFVRPKHVGDIQNFYRHNTTLVIETESRCRLTLKFPDDKESECHDWIKVLHFMTDNSPPSLKHDQGKHEALNDQERLRSYFCSEAEEAEY